jgi:uncharacterized phage protein gp47/JayE
MPIEISSLKQLDEAKVQSMVATLSQWMAERHPDVELTRGVFHDLVLYFDGLLNAAIQENIDRVRQSNSLLKINEDPTLADTEVVDQVLSNFNLTRDNGTPAVGVVTVVFNSATRTAISLATRFTAENDQVVFLPTEAFIVLPPTATATASNERKMIAVGDGTYAANITVVAAAVGAAGNIRRGTKLTPNSALNNVADVYANADFIKGKDPSTNEAYLSKLAPALAAKTIGSRQSYSASILNQTAFANIQNLSILGCGDAEQQRDQHSLFPISGGGKVDIYAQTNGYSQEKEHLLEATYVGPNAAYNNSVSSNCSPAGLGSSTSLGTIWQVTIARDTAPGFYEVVRVAAPGADNDSGYGIVSDDRGVDFSDIEFVPDILYIPESAYTRYQTAVIRFEDTDTQPSSALIPGTSKKIYSVTTTGMPLIAELQDYMSSRDVRARGTDVLVKAAVPCFTKISFEIMKPASAADPDISAIQLAISSAISQVGFSGQLHSSVISNVVHKYLSGKQALGGIDMFGRIRRPDGSIDYVRDNTILYMPTDYQRLVTGRTAAFLTSPEDVSVSIKATDFLS